MMRTKLAAIVVAALMSGTAFASDRSDVRAMSAAGVAPTARHAVTAEQRALLAERLALVDRALRAATADKEISADHRIWMLETMYRMPLQDLRAMPASGGYQAAVRALAKAAKAPAKLGQATSELVYYPITPCRYIDTRNAGGPLSPATIPRLYNLSNNGSSYGGSSACDPKTAVGGADEAIGALAMNIAIFQPTVAPGVVGAGKPGTAGSIALVNWYNAGATVQVSNAAVVPTDDTGAANDFEISGSATHVIVDVFGVFAAPTVTSLDCTNGTETSTTVNTTNRDFNLFANACPTGYQMMSNSCQTTAPAVDIVLAGGGVFAGGSNCFGYYSGGVVAPAFETVYNAPWCCRIPGR